MLATLLPASHALWRGRSQPGTSIGATPQGTTERCSRTGRIGGKTARAPRSRDSYGCNVWSTQNTSIGDHTFVGCSYAGLCSYGLYICDLPYIVMAYIVVAYIIMVYLFKQQTLVSCGFHLSKQQSL